MKWREMYNGYYIFCPAFLMPATHLLQNNKTQNVIIVLRICRSISCWSWNRFFMFGVSHYFTKKSGFCTKHQKNFVKVLFFNLFHGCFFVTCEKENSAKREKCVEAIPFNFSIRIIFCKMTVKCPWNTISVYPAIECIVSHILSVFSCKSW